MSARFRPRDAGVAGLVVLLALLACKTPPSDERLTCLHECARLQDTCLVDARGSDGVEACDERVGDCREECPAE